MKIVAVVCFSFVLYMDSVRCMTINEFFSRSWDSISSTWENVKVAIKRPIKIMRMGRGGKRKTTPSSMTNISTTTTKTSAPIYETIRDTNYDNLRVIPVTVKEIMTTAKAVYKKGKLKTTKDKAIMHLKPPDNKMPPIDAEYTFAPVQTKVKLPYFPRPVWKSAEEWKDMQKPYLTIILKGDENYDSEIDNTIYQNDELTLTADLNDSKDALGALMFV